MLSRTLRQGIRGFSPLSTSTSTSASISRASRLSHSLARAGPLTTSRVTQGGAANAHRFFSKVGSDDSHSDFAPQSKVAPTSASDGEENEVQLFLSKAVKDHDVLLFMKGTPNAPRCGFSNQVIQILKKHNVKFSSADVLASEEIRQGIKTFSNWPTIPQLYVMGEFVGGCDILTEMDKSDELVELFEGFQVKEE